MNIETETAFFKNGERGHIMVKVFVDGRYCGGISILAGPVAEVQDYYYGKLTMEEVEERWKKKRG